MDVKTQESQPRNPEMINAFCDQSLPLDIQYEFTYPTPLDPPPIGVAIDTRIIEINGMKWQSRSDCKYIYDYYEHVEMVETFNNYTKAQKKEFPMNHEANVYRTLIGFDLWFFIYFVMKNPLANHPFIVNACREIQAEEGDSLEVWARDHLKTTIISVGRTCQKLLVDPEKRIGIFSAVKPLALKIQNLIKTLFEDPFLYKCFPDILYLEPKRDALKWSEDGGLFIKRKGMYKEASVSSWGLVEGSPTGDHYTDMVFDDIITPDFQTPDIMDKVRDRFDMTENIGTRDRQITVVGTFYRHDDPLVYIMNKTDPLTGEKLFKTRKKPATVDGTFAGAAVFLPEKTMAKKRAGNIYFFYCQQLLDPTPRGQEKLNKDHLIRVKKKDLPSRLYRFMLIDGAGDKGKRIDRSADAWSMLVVGVEPYRDEVGSSRIFILDAIIEEMDLVTAQETAVAMYCRNGRILKLGIEKVGMSSTEIHITNALRAKKRYVSLKQNNLEILKPAGRTKQYRIESNLSWPLKNGKIHYLDTVPQAQIERLMLEMEKFPAWHDDGLDGLSYIYDMIKDYRFSEYPVEDKPESEYDRASRRSLEGNGTGGWAGV